MPDSGWGSLSRSLAKKYISLFESKIREYDLQQNLQMNSQGNSGEFRDEFQIGPVGSQTVWFTKLVSETF